MKNLLINLLIGQKLRRFNIIKDTFLVQEKPNKKKKDNRINKYLTYNRGNAGIPISRRSDDKKNMFKTNIKNSNSDINDIINIENENNIDILTIRMKLL